MSSQFLIVTDGQTDRRTDGQTDESNLNTALCTSASRGKNYTGPSNHINLLFKCQKMYHWELTDVVSRPESLRHIRHI